MISAEDAKKIIESAKEYWRAQVNLPEFRAIFKGKEVGHRIADYVDEHTTAMLKEKFTTKYEVDAKGKPRARSMGDIWFYSDGGYHPINVKAGESGKNGQPNMVSLTKLLDRLMKHEIDSYYLLIVKMSFEVDEDGVPTSVTPNIYFVDMLDYLDYITFDAGPGQTMLREKQFYEAIDGGVNLKALSLSEKVVRLTELLEDGDRRLIENRRKKMERIRKDVENYNGLGSHDLNQGGLELG